MISKRGARWYRQVAARLLQTGCSSAPTPRRARDGDRTESHAAHRERRRLRPHRGRPSPPRRAGWWHHVLGRRRSGAGDDVAGAVDRHAQAHRRARHAGETDLMAPDEVGTAVGMGDRPGSGGPHENGVRPAKLRRTRSRSPHPSPEAVKRPASVPNGSSFTAHSDPARRPTSTPPSRAIRERGTMRSRPACSASARTSVSTWE